MRTPSARLFDLERASAVSRRLHGPVSGPPEAASVRPARERSAVPIADFEALIESSATATELWEHLLDWGMAELGALGVFVLDQHGFVIATRTREGMAFPPEVFPAAFSGASAVLEPYLETGQAVRHQELRIEGFGWIAISRHELSGAPVLFCVWRPSRVRGRRIERVWQRIATTVLLYDELFRSAGTGGEV